MKACLPLLLSFAPDAYLVESGFMEVLVDECLSWLRDEAMERLLISGDQETQREGLASVNFDGEWNLRH